MSRLNFDHRDRWDGRAVEGGPIRIRYMARSGGYVMVRKPRAVPFVLSEKEWARLPLFEPDNAKKEA